MRVPVLLFVIAGGLCGVALMLPGWGDLLLLAGPAALASLILLGQAAVRGHVEASGATPAHRFRRRKSERAILIDGSNVLHWQGNSPDIAALRAVVGALTAQGFSPSVVFDANAGYLVSGRYMHDKALGDLIGLAEDRVMVVQKGQPADPVLLAAAREMGARIVTNDRYRDWAGAHPEVRDPGFLVRGGWRDGALWLELDEMAVA